MCTWGGVRQKVIILEKLLWMRTARRHVLGVPSSCPRIPTIIYIHPGDKSHCCCAQAWNLCHDFFPPEIFTFMMIIRGKSHCCSDTTWIYRLLCEIVNRFETHMLFAVILKPFLQFTLYLSTFNNSTAWRYAWKLLKTKHGQLILET